MTIFHTSHYIQKQQISPVDKDQYFTGMIFESSCQRSLRTEGPVSINTSHGLPSTVDKNQYFLLTIFKSSSRQSLINYQHLISTIQIHISPFYKR